MEFYKNKHKRLLYGVAHNDVDSPICFRVDGKKIIEPVYKMWTRVLERTLSETFKNKHPTYRECTIAEEWLKFSSFKKWMETQYWSGLELDKDILIPGNKQYGPDTCVFIPRYINACLKVKRKTSDLPLGVTKVTKIPKDMVNLPSNPYVAQVQTRQFKKVHKRFDNAEDAHKFWQQNKVEFYFNLLEKYSSEDYALISVQDAILFRANLIKEDILHGRETISI